MTLHNSKGLEFQNVFITGLEQGLFPSHRSIDTPSLLEEERRLCYVGITRAKERVFLVMPEKEDYGVECVKQQFLQYFFQKYLKI